MENPITQGPSINPEMKYCADCGKQILRKAEICPHCGCRQLPPPRRGSHDTFGLMLKALDTRANPVFCPSINEYIRSF
jgi:hypothetical protein